MPEKTRAADSGKLWNAGFIYLVFLNTVTSSAFRMVNPVLSKYVVSLGGSLAFGGVVVGTLAITALVVRPISGAIADNYDNKKILIIATVIMAATALFYSFSGSLGMLMLIRILHGAAFSFSGTTNVALATMFIPKHRMGEGIGYLGFSIVLAAAIGPGIGLAVVENFGFRANFIVSFVVTLIAAVLMFRIRYEHTERKQPEEKLKFHLKDFIEAKLIPLSVFGGLFTFCSSTIDSFIAVTGDERVISNIGIYFIVNSAMLLAIRPISGKINDKVGLAVILIPAFVFSASAMCVIAGARSIWTIVLAAVLMAIGYGSGPPVLQAEGIRRLPDKRGVATSTFLIGLDVGHGIGPIVGGAVLGSFGFGAMYVGAGALLILGMFCFIAWNRKKPA